MHESRSPARTDEAAQLGNGVQRGTAQPAAQLAGEERAAHEALCRKCARCCSVKLVIHGRVVLSPFYCPFLDEATKLCTIYPRRHELNPLCTSPDVGIKLGIWPGDCPYVDHPQGYEAPREMLPEEVRLYEAECRAAQAEIRKAVSLIIGRANP